MSHKIIYRNPSEINLFCLHHMIPMFGCNTISISNICYNTSVSKSILSHPSHITDDMTEYQPSPPPRHSPQRIPLLHGPSLQLVTVELFRDGAMSPWGFRLKGGSDVDGDTLQI
eukprot:TRINITY_DN37437_c0_g1_i1.p1 TRINITY_DN37437_c0_g1~~TRINITY_DN37437_c0_g1_i1.p1  ORF type:complete len:114 (-),score=13.48 TRINITY_DN37437_c0_g1_i1:77-418(-)